MQGVHQLADHAVEARAEAAAGHHRRTHLGRVEVQVSTGPSAQVRIARPVALVLALDLVDNEVLLAHDLVVVGVLSAAPLGNIGNHSAGEGSPQRANLMQVDCIDRCTGE